jgi:hypothetical protein
MMGDDLEKPGAVDIVERTKTEDSNDARIHEFSEAEQKAIVTRIDRRLVTTLGILYCASLMDRTNLGSAAIAGYRILFANRDRDTDLVTDLDLIGPRYNIITLIFFIPYVLCQPPATVLLRKIGPRYFLSAITIFWGATMIVSHLLSQPGSTLSNKT